jgi:hypothetical protein
MYVLLRGFAVRSAVLTLELLVEHLKSLATRNHTPVGVPCLHASYTTAYGCSIFRECVRVRNNTAIVDALQS